jgi:hypothetical protein
LKPGGGGGNITLTAVKPAVAGGNVTITAGNGVTSGQGGSITLTGGQSGKITLGTAVPGSSFGITPTDSAQWSTMAGSDDMDQLRLEMHDLKQTVQALFRANQRLCDEVEALKAGAILDPPDLA